jgi:hypothetical protein
MKDVIKPVIITTTDHLNAKVETTPGKLYIPNIPQTIYNARNNTGVPSNETTTDTKEQQRSRLLINSETMLWGAYKDVIAT